MHARVSNFVKTGKVAGVDVAKTDAHLRTAIVGYQNIATAIGKDTDQYREMERFVNQNFGGEARVQNGIDLLTGRPVDE